VVRTRVGYTGGQTKNPTYYRLGDHTETLQLDFDPGKISYAKLLEVFWSTHNACADSGSRQYMSAIFYHDGGQKKLALESQQREAVKRGKAVTTKVLPLGPFYLAEDYHQKYMLRMQPELLREFEAMYPDAKGFLASTAVARVNGYLGGNGSETELRQDLSRLGLSARAQQRLLERWKEFH
jgi:peptide-methionine (S)-S-oxide reductase